jgi:hypothetical protein
METSFGIKINLKFNIGIDAETYDDAVSYVKNIFEEQHKITLENKEIDNNKAQDLIDELKYQLMYLIQQKEIKETIFNIIEQLEGEIQ